MRVKTIIFSLFFIVTSLQAATIRGIVKDAETDEEIIGATIQIKTNPSQGTVSGLDGSFILNRVELFPTVLVVNYMGYKMHEVNVQQSDVDGLVILLEPDNFTLQELVVTGETGGRTDSSARMLEKMQPMS